MIKQKIINYLNNHNKIKMLVILILLFHGVSILHVIFKGDINQYFYLSFQKKINFYILLNWVVLIIADYIYKCKQIE